MDEATKLASGTVFRGHKAKSTLEVHPLHTHSLDFHFPVASTHMPLSPATVV
jgi:hypothetical protein